MTRTLLVALAAAALVLGGAASGSAQSPRSGEISLYVTVEHDGKLVTGLKEENFRLREDGYGRKFRLAEAEPATIVLLVEHGRRSLPYWRDIERAVEGFAGAAPAGHRYLLATFAQRVEVSEPLADGKAVLNEFRNRGRPIVNEVSVYDAVIAMLERLEKEPGRRVLVVVASGMDSFSRHTMDQVERKVEETNAVIYATGVGSALRGRLEPWVRGSARIGLLQGQAFLQLLAQRSGGQAWFPQFEGGFVSAMQGAMQNLEHHYRLVFQPQPENGRSRIEVEAFRFVAEDKREDFHVRVRDVLRVR
jgi:Ca-activated chloride channel family protein